MDKLENVNKYSDTERVFELAKKIIGDDVKIDISTRKNKKYMVLNPNTNKWVHFGQLPYYDYTKHRDEERRERFLKRNSHWASADKYSPAYLSYILLW